MTKNKTNTTTTKPKGDIDFEKELWDVANELRGAVAENQYKDYVLSLLFLKHLSERYEIRRQEIQLSFFEDPAQYGFDGNLSDIVETPYRASLPELEMVLEDDLEYQVKNVYKLPKEATWTYLRENAEQDDIKVKVDKAFVLIDEILAERNPDYKGVLEPIFVKSQLSPTQVAGLINLFSATTNSPK